MTTRQSQAIPPWKWRILRARAWLVHEVIRPAKPVDFAELLVALIMGFLMFVGVGRWAGWF